MKKLLILLVSFTFFNALNAQDRSAWSAYRGGDNIVKDKAVSRLSFPETFKLFELEIAPLRTGLFSVTDQKVAPASVVITLPNVAGNTEQYEVFEASNFEPALQQQFPEIRAFSGKGITDKYATLKLSISPQGVDATIFRTDKPNEFIEPYSADHRVYAVFQSQRKIGQMNWSCSTPEEKMAAGITGEVSNYGLASRSGANLKTLRLAQSVTAEYSNYFGAYSAASQQLVLNAINKTLTRCNGVYEKDLAVHLNLVAASTSVIFYNASTDPYDPGPIGAGGSWNGQLQSTLTSRIGEANYDIGHLFGASGGGGNAGCIGCVCVDGSKGKGYTSPADAIPQGDNFDIDYVVHEVGHQLGANHTFSQNHEGTGVNKEPGSGITIMGYAGITFQNLAPHSIDIFHQASIAQIQANLLTKTCPFTTTMSNATPVIAPLLSFTIPKSTPFALTGSATDANPGDALTYCWEQNDNATTGQTGNSSVASPTKATGPNWISFRPTASPIRYFPKLSTILAGSLVSGPLPGGSAIANTEALSSVARTLNFRLTVRDNAPYFSTSPFSIGQSEFRDLTVTVNATAGPFVVTVPNTALSWAGGSTQTITWDVAGTTAAPVSCANVKISLSTDGGLNFPYVLIASTPNDGSQALVIPVIASPYARIKVEAVANIFFDISNTNFTITAPPPCNIPTGLSASAITSSTATIRWYPTFTASTYDVDYMKLTDLFWTPAVQATPSQALLLTGLSSGTLYLCRVRSKCLPNLNSGYAQTSFTTSYAVPCGTAFEPNETQLAAKPINSGVVNSAAITTATDIDYFKITTTATSDMVFNLVGPSGVDYDMFIYNNLGILIGSGTGLTATETVSLTGQLAGTYFVKVFGFNGAFSATCYTIKATATGTGGCTSIYDISTNGTTGGAAGIPFNTKITGLINPIGDNDNYRFKITTGGTITLTLTGLPLDYDLRLLNSAGAVLATAQLGGNASETMTVTVAPGIHYAQVYGFNGANHATICYNLQVTLGTATRQGVPITKEGVPITGSMNNSSVEVYPNPVHDVLNINVSGYDIVTSIELYDVNGRRVMTKRGVKENTRVNVSALPAGLYLLKIMNAEKVISMKKIVKG